MLSTSNSLAQGEAKSARTMAREGFFLRASEQIRQKFPDLVLFVTGGFRSRSGINGALEKGSCDAIGLGRPAIAFPDLPNNLLQRNDGNDRFDVVAAPSPGWIATQIRSVGSGAESVSKLV